jgi:hypothetical protein
VRKDEREAVPRKQKAQISLWRGIDLGFFPTGTCVGAQGKRQGDKDTPDAAQLGYNLHSTKCGMVLWQHLSWIPHGRDLV